LPRRVVGKDARDFEADAIATVGRRDRREEGGDPAGVVVVFVELPQPPVSADVRHSGDSSFQIVPDDAPVPILGEVIVGHPSLEVRVDPFQASKRSGHHGLGCFASNGAHGRVHARCPTSHGPSTLRWWFVCFLLRTWAMWYAS